MSLKVLILGSKGYIGSHILQVLLEDGIDVIGLDIEECDIRDLSSVEKMISSYLPTHVIHLAGLKSVPESVQEPKKYYQTNIIGTKNLILMMEKYKIPHLIFSSSATVYKNGEITYEEAELEANNPYGETKIIAEEMIRKSNINYAIIRFFNPIGSFVGLRESLTSTNLFPQCIKAAVMKQRMNIYGNATRDYFYVGDLARFHLLLLKEWKDNLIINFGTGQGMTTGEFIRQFELSNNLELEKEYHDERLGDKPYCVADVTKLKDMFPHFKLTDRRDWFLIHP